MVLLYFYSIKFNWRVPKSGTHLRICEKYSNFAG